MPDRSYTVMFRGADAPTIGVLAAALHRLARDQDFVFSVEENREDLIDPVPVLEQVAVVHLLDGQELACEVDVERVCREVPRARLIIAVDAEGGQTVLKNNTGTEVTFR